MLGCSVDKPILTRPGLTTLAQMMVQGIRCLQMTVINILILKSYILTFKVVKYLVLKNYRHTWRTNEYGKALIFKTTFLTWVSREQAFLTALNHSRAT